MRRAAPLALALAAASAFPAPARAQPHPLQYDLRVDAAIALGTWAVYGTSELAKSHLAPSSCRWCDPGKIDAKVRDALVWGYIDHAQTASDVMAFAVFPLAMTTHQVLAARGAGDTGAGWVDVLLVAEAVGIAMDVNQAVKFAVGRQRPFVHYGNWSDPNRQPDPDDNLSFYSGHTTFTFAVAAAAGTVSSMRGYRSAPWVWGVGMTLATATGYLRIAGDKHYLTDVLVGAATGLTAGIVIPRVMHPREDGKPGATTSMTITPFPLGVSGVF
ncbi:MAG TPA: phosphatase PAP2 family protein [Anaeromyxobacter sp.]|nr:phosphatase PAP2 family protein [Anaeromyxobacter sp.]